MTDPAFKWVEVTVKLPEPVVDYLKALQQFTGRNITEYMSSAIRDVVLTDLEELQATLPETPDLKEKYGLNKADVNLQTIWKEAPAE